MDNQDRMNIIDPHVPRGPWLKSAIVSFILFFVGLFLATLMTAWDRLDEENKGKIYTCIKKAFDRVIGYRRERYDIYDEDIFPDG